MSLSRHLLNKLVAMYLITKRKQLYKEFLNRIAGIPMILNRAACTHPCNFYKRKNPSYFLLTYVTALSVRAHHAQIVF